ncbi:DUF1697 domain-containing protein [Arachidicoccus sp.]|uniref:DUF1697 domain-containing protein n=1 Tax=Arachidicoccus sp. TaxID=1872624 RepID=UPI003D24FD54
MQYIIFLRGVNVGGRTIKMADLKACIEKAGYKEVQTVLQTGNVILETYEVKAEKLQQKIEALLSATFAYAARVLAITPEELEGILQGSPFKINDPAFHRYIVFTKEGFEKELVKDSGILDRKIEEIQIGKNAVYWRVLKGNTLDSTFGKYLGKVGTKHFITSRNSNTIEKIMAKCL